MKKYKLIFCYIGPKPALYYQVYSILWLCVASQMHDIFSFVLPHQPLTHLYISYRYSPPTSPGSLLDNYHLVESMINLTGIYGIFLHSSHQRCWVLYKLICKNMKLRERSLITFGGEVKWMSSIQSTLFSLEIHKWHILECHRSTNTCVVHNNQ